jgi:hypothetical protein
MDFEASRAHADRDPSTIGKVEDNRRIRNAKATRFPNGSHERVGKQKRVYASLT